MDRYVWQWSMEVLGFAVLVTAIVFVAAALIYRSHMAWRKRRDEFLEHIRCAKHRLPWHVEEDQAEQQMGALEAGLQGYVDNVRQDGPPWGHTPWANKVSQEHPRYQNTVSLEAARKYERRMRDTLIAIRDYWDLDQDPDAMASTLWRIIHVASEALEKDQV